jgi:hypothetical protein
MKALKTHNDFSRAAIVAKYKGPTDSHGSRILVNSNRGRKSYPYPHELSNCERFVWAVDQYLQDIAAKDRKEYGQDAIGWGEISSFSVGQLSSGEYVFVNNR